ncbi:MAG TPA: hypothetical protein VEC35_13190 [Noviherbaspirillum sp.]|nr:hypothetical protein [Noviherbaspirillum sp.]
MPIHGRIPPRRPLLPGTAGAAERNNRPGPRADASRLELLKQAARDDSGKISLVPFERVAAAAGRVWVRALGPVSRAVGQMPRPLYRLATPDDTQSVFKPENLARFCNHKKEVLDFLHSRDVARQIADDPEIQSLMQAAFAAGCQLYSVPKDEVHLGLHRIPDQDRVIKIGLPDMSSGEMRLRCLAELRQALLVDRDLASSPLPLPELFTDYESFRDAYISHRMDAQTRMHLADTQMAREAGARWSVRKTGEGKARLHRSPYFEAWPRFKAACKAYQQSGSTDAVAAQWKSEKAGDDDTLTNGERHEAEYLRQASREWINHLGKQWLFPEQIETVLQILDTLHPDTSKPVEPGDELQDIPESLRPLYRDALEIQRDLTRYAEAYNRCEGLHPDDFRRAYYHKIAAQSVLEEYRASLLTATEWAQEQFPLAWIAAQVRPDFYPLMMALKTTEWDPFKSTPLASGVHDFARYVLHMD